jgi:hypothetical protein
LEFVGGGMLLSGRRYFMLNREELAGESFGGTCSIVIPPALEPHLGFLLLQMVNTPHGLLTP